MARTAAAVPVRRKEARPAEISAAALQLFLRQGFAATKTDDVARAAGVSKGTVYLYFPSKEDLFRAVIRQAIEPLLQQAKVEIAAYDGSARELLERLVRRPFTELWDDPINGIGKLIMAEAHHFPNLSATYVQELVRESREVLIAVLEHGIARGEFQISDVPYAARAILGLVDYPHIMRHSIGQYDSEPLEPERYADMLLDLLLNGIARGKETKR